MSFGIPAFELGGEGSLWGRFFSAIVQLVLGELRTVRCLL